jgi:4-hydroxy-3-methylbut-2-enyl diphosphate reductase
VKSLTDFGAFIDLGGVDGLLHVSELSWGRVAHPSEVLKEGDSVTVRVIRLDPEHDRISLSLREAQPNPWDLVTARYPVDSIHEARVVRLANFGAFVELEPGIDGLVHVSELSDRHVNRPSEVVAVGDPVTVKVLRVSPEERRVSLTMRGVHQTGGLPATDLRHGGAEDLSGYTVGDHLHGRDF